MARPLRYDPKLADAILRDIQAGHSVTVACRRAGVPRTTFSTWVTAGRGQLANRLAQAKARTKKAVPENALPPPAAPATGDPDRFAAFLAVHRQQMAARREEPKPECEAAAAERPENPETPQITATYTPNRAALRLIAASLEAVAAELRRGGAV